MPHPASYRAALRAVLAGATAVLVLLLPLLAPTSAAPRVAEPEPLLVHLDSISPTLPRRGTLEITGTVTNTTDTDFTRVNLHAISSALPITEAQNLADSAATPAEEFVGNRVTVPGTFDTVEVLAAGQSEEFSISVPVELLEATGEPGVYWAGVHAFGDGEVPRDDVADGRARTFVPALPRGDGSLEAAVVLPLRSRVWYAADGALGGTERWARWLAEGGRLDTALDVADAAGGNTYTWLVDPAILTSVARLAAGNPPRSLAPDPAFPGQEPTETPTEAEPTEEATPAPTAFAVPACSAVQPAPTAADPELAAAAAAWLVRFCGSAAGRAVLALPFGDLDVSAAVRNRAERLEEARTRTAEVMTALGIPFQPALAPENDVLSSEALLATPDDTTILMGDTAFDPPPETPDSLVRLLGHRVVVTSTGAQAGGPAPTPAEDPLAMRQRLLSEAALRVANGSTAPVVVTLPSGWSPEDAGALFSAFDEPWLSSVSITDIQGRRPVWVSGTALAYTDEDVSGELPAASFLAADRLDQAAGVLEEVLLRQTTVEQQVRDEVLVTLSQQHRDRARPAQRSAGAARKHIADQLGKVRILPINRVTLSSDSGDFGATLENGLDQPVEVAVVATADGEMTLDVIGPVVRRLEPGSRSRVNVTATAERAGVHNVRLSVRSAVSDTALGSSARLPIRAAQVSGLIWVVMAAGASLLLSAAGLRLWRQVRRRPTGTDDAAEPAQDAEDAEGAGEPERHPGALGPGPAPHQGATA